MDFCIFKKGFNVVTLPYNPYIHTKNTKDSAHVMEVPSAFNNRNIPGFFLFLHFFLDRHTVLSNITALFCTLVDDDLHGISWYNSTQSTQSIPLINMSTLNMLLATIGTQTMALALK